MNPELEIFLCAIFESNGSRDVVIVMDDVLKYAFVDDKSRKGGSFFAWGFIVRRDDEGVAQEWNASSPAPRFEASALGDTPTSRRAFASTKSSQPLRAR